MPLRVLIADDHDVVRLGLQALLAGNDQDVEIVAEAVTGAQAIRQVEKTKPDLVLMDISLPELGGVEATRRLKELSPETRVLIVTIHDDRVLMQEAIRAGASGYVLKQAVKSELLHAVKTVMRGQLYIDPVMAQKLLLEPLAAPQEKTPAAVELLTERELEVLKLLAQGYTNRQIGKRLGISVRTAEYHRANLMSKVGASGRVDLVRYAKEHDLF